jgi:UDP-glucose 4-epimerase
MTILVTGGAGYIGSHSCILLIEAGYSVVVFDNFSNSSRESINRVEKIVNHKIPVIEGDIRNRDDLREVFESYKINAVIHFAGLKAVGESVNKPLKYYDNNISGTIILCEIMAEYGCKSIVFSSSATVYGNPKSNPITEDFPVGSGITNPYGRSKYIIEEILKDLFISDNEWKIVILRYFNPVGAYKSGTIGEDPNDIPNNLMPFIAQTAVGKREYLSIFGDDYNTHDGTGVRDYIHVMDLADGHIKAIDKINSFNQVMTINLGTGNGYSVLDMVKAFEKASNRSISYIVTPRREGDIDACYANPSYAHKILGWVANRGVEMMCEDTWRWQLNNPNGYN